MTSRSDSESSASPIVVDPLRSEKTIVTVFRTSCGAATGASGVPQKPQRRNLAGFSSPHEGHIAIRRVYVGLHGFLNGPVPCLTLSIQRPLLDCRYCFP